MKSRVLIVAVGLLAAVAAYLVMPRPPHPGATQTGDAALADRVRAAVGDGTGHRGLAVAMIENGRTTLATLGEQSGGDRYEIGSLAKPLTGMLLADLVADGVVRPTDTLASTLPQVTFVDPATGAITLEELASHRSGLPRLAGINPLTGARASLSGGNPYAGMDVDALLAAAATARVGSTRGSVEYSNFGMSLLGQALATRAGTAARAASGRTSASIGGRTAASSSSATPTRVSSGSACGCSTCHRPAPPAEAGTPSPAPCSRCSSARRCPHWP
jgi:CubicO group peptidase (beta-lactamase class C family)